MRGVKEPSKDLPFEERVKAYKEMYIPQEYRDAYIWVLRIDYNEETIKVVQYYRDNGDSLLM